MRKRLIGTSLAICVGLISPIFAAGTSFSDVPSTHWAYSYVETASQNGWIAGIGDGTFGVNDQVTYTQLSTMLVRAFYNDEYNAYNGPSDAWYTSFCNVADGAGLFDGTAADGQIQVDSVVNQPVSRYDMAQMMYNVLVAEKAVPGYDAAAVQSGVADWDSIPENYQNAVLGSVAAGIISGVDEKGTFDGLSLMTRGQAAVVMTQVNRVIAKAQEPEAPAGTGSQEEQEPVKTSGTYVGSVDSDKYHYPGCRFAEKILPENEIWFDTEEEAAAAGYVPCGVCKP